MHKRYLWMDRRGAELRWPAAGNVNVSATGQGTLALWVRLQRAQDYWMNYPLWRVEGNGANWLGGHMGRASEVRRDGTYYRLPTEQVNNRNQVGWELQIHEWDFVAGWIQSWYNDNQEAGPALSGVPGPNAAASYLRLGYAVTDPVTWNNDHLLCHGLAVWEGLMEAEQRAALYAAGPLHELRESDGAGTLTFLARLNEALDGDLGGGEIGHSAGETTAADRYCLLSEGIRELGTAVFPLGLPRHDGGERDRLPLNAVCALTHDTSDQRNTVVDENETNYAALTVTGFTGSSRAGAAYPSLPMPGTYRQQLHVPNEGNRAGYEMGIGPVAYKHYPGVSEGVFDQLGSGRQFLVVADAGNTAQAFVTDLSERFADDFWVGARVQFYTGSCAGRALEVAGYDAETKVLTLEAELPETPGEGSRAVVSFHPRVLGQYAPTGELMPEYSLPAYLWCNQTDSKHFTELEWEGSYNTGFLRYERGRTAVIPGSTYDGMGHGLGYGKWHGYTDPEPTELAIWLRKIEVCGPQRYELLRKDDRGRGPALADNFMVLARDPLGSAGDSVKVWRKLGLALVQDKPTKYPSLNQATADLAASGTWRNTPWGPPFPVAYDEARGEITCALQGQDQAGAVRLGYIVGRYNETTGRIEWEDETPPAGKSNPVLETAELSTDAEPDAPVTEHPWLENVIQSVDGTWSLLYGTRPDQVDSITVYALHGAPDRWSFDPERQFAGPLLPMFRGVDTLEPYGGNGFVPWANMHLYWSTVDNVYAQQTERRFLGFAGGKTIYNEGSGYATDLRPVVGYAGADVKSPAPLPWGNSLSPLAGPNISAFHATVLGQEDCLAILYNDGFSTGVGLLTSEDGVHFQRLYRNWGTTGPLLPAAELPGESLHLVSARPFRLGDRRIYYYQSNNQFNFATIRWNGELYYELGPTETTGWLETAILQRPAGGWGELFVNVDPRAGTARVELIDPAEELTLPGYSAAECEALADGVRQQVSWGGVGLAELTAEYVRVRVHLERATAEADSPQLYGWELGLTQVVWPEVSGLLVEGESDPAGVTDPTPSFAWTYHDPQSRAQAAYQVQVASTAELLEAGLPDMWDSGVVPGSETSVEYAGLPLGDLETYFWRVRARTAEGEWSESW